MAIEYILWPLSTYTGTTLRPKCILYGYMDPLGFYMGSIGLLG